MAGREDADAMECEEEEQRIYSKKNNFHVCNQKSTNQFIEYHFLINVG